MWLEHLFLLKVYCQDPSIFFFMMPLVMRLHVLTMFCSDNMTWHGAWRGVGVLNCLVCSFSCGDFDSSHVGMVKLLSLCFFSRLRPNLVWNINSSIVRCEFAWSSSFSMLAELYWYEWTRLRVSIHCMWYCLYAGSFKFSTSNSQIQICSFSLGCRQLWELRCANLKNVRICRDSCCNWTLISHPICVVLSSGFTNGSLCCLNSYRFSLHIYLAFTGQSLRWRKFIFLQASTASYYYQGPLYSDVCILHSSG